MNKDKVTNICGLVIVVAGALIAADKSGQIQLGGTVDAVLGVLQTVAGALVAYFTGKPSTPTK